MSFNIYIYIKYLNKITIFTCNKPAMFDMESETETEAPSLKLRFSRALICNLSSEISRSSDSRSRIHRCSSRSHRCSSRSQRCSSRSHRISSWSELEEVARIGNLEALENEMRRGGLHVVRWRWKERRGGLRERGIREDDMSVNRDLMEKKCRD